MYFPERLVSIILHDDPPERYRNAKVTKIDPIRNLLLQTAPRAVGEAKSYIPPRHSIGVVAVQAPPPLS